MDAYDLNYSFSETLGSGHADPAQKLSSFAYMAIALAATVAGGSALLAVQSKKQMWEAGSLRRQ